MTTQAVTVVRLPYGGRGTPIARVLSVVGRADLALTDELHRPGSSGEIVSRPYGVVVRPDALDVAACDDRLASALLSGGGDAARLVTRTLAANLIGPGCEGDTLTLAFEAPTMFRVAGFDHLLPDAGLLFGGLLGRWRALGWPELPDLAFARLAVRPRVLAFVDTRRDGDPVRGFVGEARFHITSQSPEQRAAIWTLARFAEWRGAGKHTSYGLGRVRIVRAPADGWSRGRRLAVWDPAR